MVQDLELTWNNDFTKFNLSVLLRNNFDHPCVQCDLGIFSEISVKFTINKGFKSHPGPALYQINRFAISMHSLFIHNSSFLDRVTVVLSESVPGLEGWILAGK